MTAEKVLKKFFTELKEIIPICSNCGDLALNLPRYDYKGDKICEDCYIHQNHLNNGASNE